MGRVAPFRAEVGLTDLVAAVLPLVFSLSVFTIQHSGSGTINFGGNMRVAGTTFVTIGGSSNYISGSLLDLGTIRAIGDIIKSFSDFARLSHGRAGAGA